QMLGEKISSFPFLADVAVPLPMSGTSVLTYRVSAAFSSQLTLGVRVVVPVVKRKLIGIFIRWSELENATAPEKIKEILDIIDETPVFSQNLMALWHWATKYYLTSPGEMLGTILPGWMLTESKIVVQVKKECVT